MKKFACFQCSYGPMHGVTIFRQNEKGKPPIWACEAHSREIDEETRIATAMVERAFTDRQCND